MCNPDSYLEIDMSALSEEYLINFNHFNGVEILKIIVRDLKSNLSVKNNKIVFDCRIPRPKGRGLVHTKSLPNLFKR